MFNDSYEDAQKKGYRDLEPANLYNVDYSMIGTARVEPLMPDRIRNSMAGAGMKVENSKGECNFGQHEVDFHYALATADDHVIYKTGAKEIAAQEGMSITYMAKLDEREGNSCHIHCSIQHEGGGNVFADDEEMFHRFVAGQLAGLRDLTLKERPLEDHERDERRPAQGVDGAAARRRHPLPSPAARAVERRTDPVQADRQRQDQAGLARYQHGATSLRP